MLLLGRFETPSQVIGAEAVAEDDEVWELGTRPVCGYQRFTQLGLCDDEIHDGELRDGRIQMLGRQCVVHCLLCQCIQLCRRKHAQGAGA